MPANHSSFCNMVSGKPAQGCNCGPKPYNLPKRFYASGMYVRGPARPTGSGYSETVFKTNGPKFAELTAMTLNEFIDAYENKVAELEARLDAAQNVASHARRKLMEEVYRRRSAHDVYGLNVQPKDVDAELAMLLDKVNESN